MCACVSVCGRVLSMYVCACVWYVCARASSRAVCVHV